MHCNLKLLYSVSVILIPFLNVIYEVVNKSASHFVTIAGLLET